MMTSRPLKHRQKDLSNLPGGRRHSHSTDSTQGKAKCYRGFLVTLTLGAEGLVVSSWMMVSYRESSEPLEEPALKGL